MDCHFIFYNEHLRDFSTKNRDGSFSFPLVARFFPIINKHLCCFLPCLITNNPVTNFLVQRLLGHMYKSVFGIDSLKRDCWTQRVCAFKI
jgi:hypothetical protein